MRSTNSVVIRRVCVRLAAACVACCWAACEAPSPGPDDATRDAGNPGPCGGGCLSTQVCRISNIDPDGTCVAPALEDALCHVDDRGSPPTVTLTYPCADGLECARTVSDFPTLELACAPAGNTGRLCEDYTAVSGDDGCADPLVCSATELTCVALGDVGAPCESDDDCDASVCRVTPGGTARCIVDDCDAGCEEGLVCLERGDCGSTCGAPAVEGALCRDAPNEEPCSFEVACIAGLDCVVAYELIDGGTASQCVAGSALGDPCAGIFRGEDSLTDGCADGLRCSAASLLCVDENAARARGDVCDDAAQCSSGQCDAGRCVEHACDDDGDCAPGQGCATGDCTRACVDKVADGDVCAAAPTPGSCIDEPEHLPCVDGSECAVLDADDNVRCAPESGVGGPCDFVMPEDGCRDDLTCFASADGLACG